MSEILLIFAAVLIPTARILWKICRGSLMLYPTGTPVDRDRDLGVFWMAVGVEVADLGLRLFE